jgi:hypothetical protein
MAVVPRCGTGRISGQGTPCEPAAGRLAAPGGPFEPAAGRFSGQAIVGTVSYFSFRSNGARSRAENSCSTGQIWCRLTEIAQTCSNCDGQVWYRF